MKRRNQTTVTIVGQEQAAFLPRTSVLMGPVGDKKYLRLSWLHFVSDGRMNTGYFGLSSEYEMACEITSLNLKKSRFTDAIESGRITDMQNGPDDRSMRFTFLLKRKEGFCESSLDVATLILESLGVIKEDVKSAIQGFYITQNPEIKYRGQWMSYGQYLLLTHPLLKAT